MAETLDSVTGARITVVAEIPDARCNIRADLSRFETALINMAVNARDAMGGRGHVDPEAHGGPPDAGDPRPCRLAQHLRGGGAVRRRHRDSARRAAAHHLDGASLCVLVVEDNIEVGRFATQILDDLGHKTVWSTTAEEALVEIERIPFRFDAVFSDVMMPALPVVVTSGYSHVLAQEGVHGFDLVQKPYPVDQLSQILRKVIGRGRAGSRRARA
ncbi:hypothetical protein [Methylobacterium sp. P1-11]|uniref:ATP-binding response regulator n=1 Tax=Methylobacterium sp. P1-11 TaxID=2024616 RepID=UPI001FEF0FA5|nr:hypothetical protein [Methylobacterium sp. P1-11]